MTMMNEIEKAITHAKSVVRANEKEPYYPKYIHDFYKIAIQALQEKADRDNPQPLTLGELKGFALDCRPVYVCNVDKQPMFRENIYCGASLDLIPVWGSFKLHLQAIYGRNLTLDEDNYGISWLAYKHKPKEV